jgi:light-regulated signal transduction histidine kinase (bacteriophytochrome)
MPEDTTKALEKERDLLARDLRECSAQLQALTTELQQFTYAVSHDLRAPLRAMEGFAQILLEDHSAQLDAEGKRALEIILVSARKTAVLIEDLTVLSRLCGKPLASASVKMDELVQGKIAQLREEGATAVFAVGHLPEAWGDKDSLAVVWEQLLKNAVKFTRRRSRPAITVNGRDEGRQTVYEVRDNGVGFDPKRASRLFNLFQKLHEEPEFEGRGVGLAMVRRIIHRHGGSAWAEGKVNKGATFFFSLPRRESTVLR